MLEALQYQDCAAVSHYESATVKVEGQRSVLRILGTGKGLRVGESRNSKRDGGILATAGEYGIGIAVLDRAVSLAQVVGRGGAGGDDIDAGAPGVILNGYMASCDVRYHRRDEKWRNPLPRRVFNHFLGLPELNLESADTGTHIHAEAEGIDIGIVTAAAEPCVVHCLIGSCHAILREHTLLAGERLVHAELKRIEILYLTGNVDREKLRVEFGDFIDAADTVLKIIPESGDIVSNRRDDSQASDYNSMFFHGQ